MSLHPAVQRRIREENPDPSKWNTELAMLLDGSVEARPLNLPTMKDVRLKDSSMVIYRVRRTQRDATRFLELKAAGYTPVTLADIENPKDLTIPVSEKDTEILEGPDLVWMKAKKEIHYAALKFHQQRALQMTQPRKSNRQEALMRTTPLSDGERAALNAGHTRDITEQEATDFESRASENNSVQRGTPKWEEIAKDIAEKKSKKE